MKTETNELGQQILEATRRAIKLAVERKRLLGQSVAISDEKGQVKIIKASDAVL
ncbi:MAG: hypothetical protein LH606_22460 [Cytophagaceae bacterium]|nr:hypothetical protein [Cytophagaceae bacterium]